MFTKFDHCLWYFEQISLCETFWALTTVSKIQVCCVATSWRLVNVYRRFEGSYYVFAPSSSAWPWCEGITIVLKVGKNLPLERTLTTQKVLCLVLHLPRDLALGTDVHFSRHTIHFIHPSSRRNLRILSWTAWYILNSLYGASILCTLPVSYLCTCISGYCQLQTLRPLQWLAFQPQLLLKVKRNRNCANINVVISSGNATLKLS